MKSMNDLLDQGGTYVVEENGDLTCSLLGSAFAGPSTMVAVKQADGTYKAELKMSGHDGENITVLEGKPNSFFDLKGSDSFGGEAVNYSTTFTSATEATMKIMGGMPVPAEEFTYTFEENVITLTKGETVVKSTWDEAKGTYKADIPYSISMGAQPMNLTAHVSYNLW